MSAKAVPTAERAALAAIRADSEDPWAHYALGSVYLFDRRFDDSLAEFELALRLNPNFSLARGYYGLALTYCGRWEEGYREARHALRLSQTMTTPASTARTPMTAASLSCACVSPASFLLSTAISGLVGKYRTSTSRPARY